VRADDPASGTDPLRHNASHDPGPAGHVQSALARREASGVDQQRRPRAEDVPGMVALVEFGCLRRNLPRLVLPQPLPPRLRDIRCTVCLTALICSGGGDLAFKADIANLPRYFCFVPKADLRTAAKVSLLDHLVGAPEVRERDRGCGPQLLKPAVAAELHIE